MGAKKLNPALEAALVYASRAWPVAPAHSISPRGGCTCGRSDCGSPGKHPLTEHGLNDATTDEKQIREWWDRWPWANVIIRTGMVGDRCLVALDIDPRHDGDENLQMLEARHGALPTTPRQITGSQGQHFLFWSKVPVRNTAGKIARGIDTRGEGGYVVAAPSKHESGREYTWDVGAHPDDVGLAEAPQWLVTLVGKAPVQPAAHTASAFIDGGRNNALTSLAGSMRDRGMERMAIEAALLVENDLKCRPPLDPAEVKRIARSVSRYAPKDVPEGEVAPRKSLTFADVVAMWKAEGPVTRAATGWPSFDEAARGGLAFGRRTFLVGAPNAGKTAVATALANKYWREGYIVGIHAVDEEPDDITARFAQMAGHQLEETESGDPEKLDAIGHALKDDGVFLYDHGWSIEAAADDLAAHARRLGRKAVYVVDSVQTVRCAESMKADGPRLIVGANVRALKTVTSAHKFLLIATSEMGRGGYGNEEAAKNFNDMAAGKESGDIEYAAAVQIVVRSVKGVPDKIRVNVPKLKRGKQVEFFLRLNRATHSLSECDAPVEENVEDAKRSKMQTRIREDVATLRQILMANPGVGVRELRSLAAQRNIGKDRVGDALVAMGPEVGRREGVGRRVELFIDGRNLFVESEG
jgi:KaiC/GvpD/RAD55 family RecA-like ATPase